MNAVIESHRFLNEPPLAPDAFTSAPSAITTSTRFISFCMGAS